MSDIDPLPEGPADGSAPPNRSAFRGCAGWAWILIIVVVIVIVWLIVTHYGYRGAERNAPPPGMIRQVLGVESQLKSIPCSTFRRGI